jgi:hypothetical protein
LQSWRSHRAKPGPPVEESVAVSGIFDRGQLVIEPWLDDPMPDYECNPPLWQV